MSYYPYFRGKQFELIAIRENAQRMADSKFVPIIEPVKKDMAGLTRAIQAVVAVKGKVIVVMNPKLGDMTGEISSILSHLTKSFNPQSGVTIGIHLGPEDNAILFKSYLSSIPVGWEVSILHDGYPNAAESSQISLQDGRTVDHIFMDDSKLYRRHFRNFKSKVLIRDGFEKRKNREHPSYEPFSDLHVTFPDEGVSGFGDFLVVGVEFSESGGPAYAIAIHLTCIDSAADDGMFIHHFVSDRTDTPTDPAGKFGEALAKLVAEVNRPGTMILKTNAVQEYLDLHEKGHFPGLGYVKKLSMQHHIELMADFLGK